MLFNSNSGCNDRQKSISKSRRSARPQSRRKNGNALDYSNLESRKLLAGINLDAGSGELTIWGDNTADVGSFEQINSTQYRGSDHRRFLDGL
jgi:hypothetical protein